MTATAPAAPQPTPEQLTAYADQLPELYKDILVAFQYSQPSRVRGQGVLEGTLRNFIFNRSRGLVPGNFVGTIEDLISPPHSFSDAARDMTDREFSAAIDRLTDAGFFEDRYETRFGSLIPTPLGERILAVVSGKETPARKLPDLPKPTW